MLLYGDCTCKQSGKLHEADHLLNTSALGDDERFSGKPYDPKPWHEWRQPKVGQPPVQVSLFEECIKKRTRGLNIVKMPCTNDRVTAMAFDGSIELTDPGVRGTGSGSVRIIIIVEAHYRPA